MRAVATVVGAVTLVVLAASTAAAAHTRGTTRCVGPRTGCFRTLAAAVKAARDGDTIVLASGTYAGVVIDKSVTVVGAGAHATKLSGGGPVLTIGGGMGRGLDVSISKLTITGGVSRSSPRAGCGPDIPDCGRGYARATALAGGIEVLPTMTVTVTDSVITGNRADPGVAVPSVTATCPDGPCSFAQAAAGGIDNWGTLTLVRTRVSNNRAGGALTAQADGGGIVNELRSSLTLVDSTVTGNRATTGPDGRFADGGGIYVDRFGTVVLRGSVVSHNSSSLTSTYPKSVREMSATTGGIFVGNGGTVTVDGTTISGNVVSVEDREGDPIGIDAGICVCGPRTTLVMRNSKVTNNLVTVTVETSIAAAGGSGGALEADGDATITGVRVTGNRVLVRTSDGLALAIAVVILLDGDKTPAQLDGTVISGNSVSASSTTGSVGIFGAGLANNRPTVLANVQIMRNVARATAPTGWVRGGGVFNGLVFFRPTPELTLRSSSVTSNSIEVSAGITGQGGGLFTKGFHVTMQRSVIANNRPDQCFGC